MEILTHSSLHTEQVHDPKLKLFESWVSINLSHIYNIAKMLFKNIFKVSGGKKEMKALDPSLANLVTHR
jgi:hypothetical protein